MNKLIFYIFQIILLILILKINSKFGNQSHNFSSVVIIACARDVEQYLPIAIKVIEDMCLLFNKSSVIIFENDSTDRTLELLNNWDKAKVISEKDVKGLRTHRLDYARNKLMSEALKEKSEYIIIIDIDDKCIDITNESILSTLNNEIKDWAMMGANQNGYYYDIWALRTFDGWMPGDYLTRENCKEGECTTDRDVGGIRNISKNHKPIEVRSCFGGLGVYKTKYIGECKYYGGEGSKEVCEHVAFNECIYKNGGKLYINPAMINS